MAKKKNWIQGAVNPAHKGFCTPMTKSTCTPRRKAFAKTMKKNHGFHENGGLQQYDFGGTQDLLAPFPTLENTTPNNQLQLLPSVESAYMPPIYPIDNTAYTTPLLDHSTTIANKPKSTTKLDYTKIPQLNIGSTNPYFASASNHFNNAIKFGYQAGMPKAANGLRVPTQEDPNYLDPTQNFDPQYSYYGQQQPIDWNVLGGAPLPQESPLTPLSESVNSYKSAQNVNNNINQIGNGIASGAEGVLGAINTGKGILDNVGNAMQNRRIQQKESAVRHQAIFNQAQDLPLGETQGYSWQGRNNAILESGGSVGGNLVVDKFKFIPKSENGSMIKEIGGQGMPNVSVEGQENITLPSGLSENIQGPSHAEGGIDLQLPEGSMIFSEKLKDPLTKKSYAKLAKPFETKKNVEMLESNKGDEIQQKTNEKMIQIKNQKLQELFALQENSKLIGQQGRQAQKETQQEYQMKNGGKIKFKTGGQTREEWINSDEYKKILSELSGDPNKKGAISKETRDKYNDILFNKANEFSSTNNTNSPAYITPVSHLNETPTNYDRSVQPSGVPHHDNSGKALFPKVNWEANANAWTNVGRQNGTLNSDQPIPSEINFKGTPQEQTNAGLQEFQYDSKLDALDKAGDKYKSTPEYNDLVNMWKSGLVQGNHPEKYKGKDLKNPSLQDLKDLRGNFIDGKLETRHLNPTTQAPLNPAQAKAEALTPITNQPANIINRTNQNNIGIPNLNFNIPSNYARDPVYTSQLSPQYIDPRYLDINPQLNAVSRGKRAVLNTLGDRSASSVSNALQGQINAYNQDEQAYGTKYNYDNQQDAHAQEFNAGAKMNVDRENLGERNRFYDAIARREGVLDTQKRTDAQSLIENSMKERNYQATSDYINKTFNPSQYNNTQLIDLLNSDAGLKALRAQGAKSMQFIDKQGTAQDYTKTTYKKGGKVKIKPKLKY